MSVTLIVGLVGVSMYSILVLGRKAETTASGEEVSTKLNSNQSEPEVAWRVEKRRRTPLRKRTDMVSGAQQAKDRIDAGHPGSKDVSAVAAFEFGDGALQRFSIGMIGARVVVAVFVFALTLRLHVSGRLIDRRDDGAGGRIRFLADVDGISSETHVYSSWREIKNLQALITSRNGCDHRDAWAAKIT